MSSWTPTTYKTKNWSDYNRALMQRGSLSIWFDAEMAWEAKPSGHRGRQQIHIDAAIQACLTIKLLFGLPLRQATGFVESLLELVGLDWAVPDFSTLSRRQKALSVAIPYRGSSGSLRRLVDSTGIKAEGEGEWNARKHSSRALLRNTLPGNGRFQTPPLAQDTYWDRRANTGDTGDRGDEQQHR